MEEVVKYITTFLLIITEGETELSGVLEYIGFINNVMLNINDNVNFNMEYSGSFTCMFLEKKLDFINEFYKNFNINIDVKELYKKGIFKIYDSSVVLQDNYKDGKVLGRVSNGQIKVFDTYLLNDVGTWVHEITHYQNEDINGITNTRIVLTEAISFAMELVYIDYLKEKGLEDEYDMELFIYFRNLINIYNQSYYYFLLIELYKEKGSITFKDFIKYYQIDGMNKDTYLNTVLKETYELIGTRNCINNLRYGLAFPLSLYMFYEYKKDSSFLDKILNLNKLVNLYSVDECLKYIGIASLDNLDIFKDAYNYFNNELTAIVGRNKSL